MLFISGLTCSNVDCSAAVCPWGTDDEAADINDDGVVNVTDLLSIIDAWGACP